MSAGKIPPKTDPEARTAYFIGLARKRHGAPRNDGRTFLSGSKLEERWMTKAVELGLVPDGMSRQSWRRLAKRLADDDTARRIRRVHEARPSSVPDDDDDLLLAHYESEAARWRARAKRDRQVALAHELIAEEMESNLADFMFKLGLVS